MRSKNKIIFLSLTVLLLLTAVPCYSEISIPDRPLNHVVDIAGIINEDVESVLNRHLLELEQKTTAQMVVLTINSLEGESLEEFSIEIAHEKWKLGQKGKDNGVLLLVSLQDKKYRFEVGYGLEGVIPDSLAGSIGRTYLVPFFRKGDYSTGIYAASLAVINEIAADAGVEITGMRKPRAPSQYPYKRSMRQKPTILGTIFTIIFFIGLIYMFIRHPRLLLLLLMFSMMGGGRRGGWGGGGGFGGGFGGGGGGGFGGGGASGGW
jgi:uncharacterized protein